MVTLGLLVAVVEHERSPASYSATASVAFQSGTLAEAALQVASGGGAEPQREANTEVLTAHSTAVASAVLKQLSIKASPKELLGDVGVETAPSADVLNITASTRDPELSAALANAFAEQYIAFRARTQLNGIEVAESKLSRQLAALPPGSAESATLSQSIQKLNALRAVAGGGATVISRATPPSSPSGISLTGTAAIGVLIGLALALALIFLVESLDQRVKTTEEYEHEYRLPVLTTIPQSAFVDAPASKRVDELEPYRILRTAFDFAGVTRPVDTIMVTSAVAAEGKSTVAVDFAHAIALTGRKVALVELDLRHPSFHRHFSGVSKSGLTMSLTGSAELHEVITHPIASLPNLSVLPAGPLPPNPAELLASAKISELLTSLANDADVVVVDAPPLIPVSDAQVLIDNPVIQAVLIVARIGKTTRDDVRRARAILDLHQVEPVGIAVTGLRASRHYGYGSHYSVSATAPPSSGSPSAPRGADGRRARRQAARKRVTAVERP
ncbi:MAG TPA: polysaccharide biosynthesis tyrosine autokinase [Solirubrobacteraceae bacterium]|nr:polysaccharide biosynthesis tyrosine autokinase [Solirubrobacteraceae bacterium]